MQKWDTRWHCFNSRLRLVSNTFTTCICPSFLSRLHLREQFLCFMCKSILKSKYSFFLIYGKNVIFVLFRWSNRRKVDFCGYKSFILFVLVFRGISSAWKDSRCASLDCTAGRLSSALLQLQILGCQPFPESRAVPSAQGTLLKPGGRIFSWSASTGEHPFISRTQTCLPNDNLHG